MRIIRNVIKEPSAGGHVAYKSKILYTSVLPGAVYKSYKESQIIGLFLEYSVVFRHIA